MILNDGKEKEYAGTMSVAEIKILRLISSKTKILWIRYAGIKKT